MPEPSQEHTQQMVESAFQNPNVPKTYMNGFNIGISASDLFLVMNLMGRPLGVIHMSYTTAKTLMQALQQTIDSVEIKMGQQIRTMEEMQVATEGEGQP